MLIPSNTPSQQLRLAGFGGGYRVVGGKRLSRRANNRDATTRSLKTCDSGMLERTDKELGRMKI